MSLPDGVYTRHQVPRHTYDRLDRMNWSRLKHIGRCPAILRHILFEGEQEDTDAKLLGRATHVAIYEPERYAREFVRWEGGVRRGAKWEAFCADHRECEPLTEAQDDTARALQAAVRNHQDARRFVTDGRSELTVLWTHVIPEIGGLPEVRVEMKSRLDFVANIPAIVDFKSSADASQAGFQRTALNLLYHEQAAMYADAYALVTGQRLPYFWVVGEVKAPHVVQVYELTEEWLELGRNGREGDRRFTGYRRKLERYAYCRENETWPSYEDGVVPLEFPHWLRVTDEDPTGLGLTFASNEEGAA